MSHISVQVNNILEEAASKLLQLNAGEVDLTGRVIVCYDVDELLSKIAVVKKFPVVGIVYEGMRSHPENKPSGNQGLAGELVLTFLLVEQGDMPKANPEKKIRAVIYLDGMRDQFLGKRSPVTSRLWHFMVESPARITENMVCWTQRWSMPVVFPPQQ